MISEKVEARLAEMAAIEAGWFEDDDAPVRPETITTARRLIDFLGHEPFEIMPIRGPEDAGGTILQVEYRGPFDEIHVVVGPSEDGWEIEWWDWWLIIDREGPRRRALEGGNHRNELSRLVDFVCAPRVF